MNSLIPLWVLVLATIIHTVIHHVVRANRKKGHTIESGLWRVGYGGLLAAWLAYSIELWLFKRFEHVPQMTAIGVWFLAYVLYVLCLRMVHSPFVGQIKQFGRRTNHSVREGLTFIIPGVESIEPVSGQNKHIEMGTSDLKDTTIKKFSIPTRDSDSLAPGETLLSLEEIQNQKTEAKLPAANARGYNNLNIVVTPIYEPINPKAALSVEDEGEGIESRLAKLIAARVRHYSVQLTDDYVMGNKDLIAEKVLEDFLTEGTPQNTLMKQTGQLLSATAFRVADYEDPEIKNSQAQPKREKSQRAARMLEIEGLVDRTNLLLSGLKDANGQPVSISAELALDAVQAEDGKVTRIVGSGVNTSAAFGAAQQSVNNQANNNQNPPPPI